MNTLVSPGVNVSVVDESNYISPGSGTIPLIIIATAQDKVDPTGSETDGIARYTKKPNGDIPVIVVTSQRELTQYFGNPEFASEEGAETSEYGLLAAYSYLRQGSKVYIVRADVNLSELVAQNTSSPDTPVADETYWLDTDASSFGIHVHENNRWVSRPVTVHVDTDASASEIADPSSYDVSNIDAPSNDEDHFLVVTLSNPDDGISFGYFMYSRASETWEAIDDNAFESSVTVTLENDESTDDITRNSIATFTGITELNNALGYKIDSVANQSFALENVNRLENFVYSGGGTVKVSKITKRLNRMITNLTTTNPVVITVNDISGIAQNDIITISGISDLSDNTYKVGRARPGNRFELNNSDGSTTNGSGFSSYTGGGVVKDVTNPIGIRSESLITSVTSDTTSIPVNNTNNISSGDIIRFSDNVVTTTINNAVEHRIVANSDYLVRSVDRDNTIITIEASIPTSSNAERIEYHYNAQIISVETPSKDISNVVPQFSRMITYDTHYNTPSDPDDDDIWIKTTSPGNGLNPVIYRSNAIGSFSRVAVESVNNGYASDTYISHNGDGTIFDANTPMTDDTIALTLLESSRGGFEIQTIVDGGSESLAVEFDARSVEPNGNPTPGQLWYSDIENDLDILIRDSDTWLRINEDNIQYQSSVPTTNKAGDIFGSSATNNGTWIWVDTSENGRGYPKINRWVSADQSWHLHDNTDQSTEYGVFFDNFTSESRSSLPQGNINSGSGRKAFTDTLKKLAPSGMIGVNMALSRNTVRVWKEGIEIGTDGDDTVDAWVNAATNNADGSGAFGRLAQRRVVANAMQASIAGNKDLRDPSRNFTLMVAPNYPEVVDELATLNADRGETAFQIIDTPMRKTPNEAVSWINGIGASENGEDGLITKNTYSAVYYPSGRTTTPSGRTVTVPASHMALYTYAYNDNVSFPWFAPAGLQRGVIRNGSAVGYITSEEEFKPVTLRQSQRDALYAVKSNPITHFPREGVVIFGQKSLHPSDSALDRVNVVRLVAYLRDRFDEIARSLLFEQNNKLTRDRSVHLFETFLSDLLSRNALSDFAVVCDESNNTPTRIDKNELYIDVAIEPTKSIEFVYIPIRVVNTGTL